MNTRLVISDEWSSYRGGYLSGFVCITITLITICIITTINFAITIIAISILISNIITTTISIISLITITYNTITIIIISIKIIVSITNIIVISMAITTITSSKPSFFMLFSRLSAGTVKFSTNI